MAGANSLALTYIGLTVVPSRQTLRSISVEPIGWAAN